MMKEALLHLPEPSLAIAVTNHENLADLDSVQGVRVICGEHPVPGTGSVIAGDALLSAVEGLGADDQVLALVSGGGSALAIAPVAAISFEEKQQAGAVLLGSGLDINRMNLVRQCLSRIKGGGLLRAAAPAQVHSLILSDVIGDDLRVVASGPTVSAVGTCAAAQAALMDAGVWEDMPAAVRQHLDQGETAPPVTAATALNRIIGSNRVSLEAVLAACPAARIVEDALCGDVAEAAAFILAQAQQSQSGEVLVFGGETTVRLVGDGLGGRNQELALRVALGAQALGDDWVFLSGGTDGRDGPTDAAGGLVDSGTIARIEAAGLNPQAMLARNDSYHALQAAGDLLITGGTGTNVADVQLFLRRS
ncbi:hydroxypyruvate reductase [Amylibacter cionae]|uniref:Hydroxypyruvate reductase n=2 Tax=Neptunicoccus cionae TaxID=2035344 RepID=A0A916QRD2_9RHOB|nr:hydroxypyruvate reductase [Amylibacter cionae]